MKKFVLFLGLLLIADMINAQVPQGFKYQTVARNNAGEILASQNISFRMTILQGELPGTVVYAETHTATTNASGLATLEIGRGTPVIGDFAAINWSSTPIFLKTEIDPAGGSAYVEIGTSELLSVPFSLYAKTAGNGFSGNYNDLTNKPALWDSTWLTIKNKPTTVAGYGITDAMTTAHASNGISSGNIANWNAAFGWGNHAAAGYLTSFTETDPIFGVHPASGITSGNISNWNSAFGWGNHAAAGYLTSFTEADPIFSVHPASGITSDNISNWNSAFGWGNHATAGYLTSFTETDPIWTAASSNYYTKTNMQTSGAAALHFNNLTNKPTTVAGYGITNAMTTAHPANGITSGNITNWNTAFGWGNHAGLYRPISYVPDWYEITNKPAGQNPGDMLYWNGTQWIPVPVGSNDQVLKLNNTVPTWTSSIQVPRVITTEVTGISNFTAISGGNVSDGGDPVTERGVCWSISPNPTIANDKTNDGSGPGTYTSNITALFPATTYYIRAFATNGAGTGYGNELNFTTTEIFTCGNSFTDIRNGKSYTTVQIGTQCWMAQNLNIGTLIAGTTEQSNNTTIEKYCYSNTEANCDVYGGLYQWNEMMNYSTTPGMQGICPTGWHLPTDAEWCTITTHLDATVNCATVGWSGTNAGGKMKETGTSHWTSPNTGATNSSGFTGLPGGYRTTDGTFAHLGINGIFVSSSEYSSANAWFRSLNNSFSSVNHDYSIVKGYGFSVRCLRD